MMRVWAKASKVGGNDALRLYVIHPPGACNHATSPVKVDGDEAEISKATAAKRDQARD